MSAIVVVTTPVFRRMIALRPIIRSHRMPALPRLVDIHCRRPVILPRARPIRRLRRRPVIGHGPARMSSFAPAPVNALDPGTLSNPLVRRFRSRPVRAPIIRPRLRLLSHVRPIRRTSLRPGRRLAPVPRSWFNPNGRSRLGPLPVRSALSCALPGLVSCPRPGLATNCRFGCSRLPSLVRSAARPLTQAGSRRPLSYRLGRSLPGRIRFRSIRGARAPPGGGW